jgi:predicted DNA-binding protein
MPAVSLHLSQKILEVIKAKASAAKIPVSQILREAVEQYLHEEEKRKAKERVLKFFKDKPLGGKKGWENFHRERTGADGCRG